ncbi:hypothetical protein [Pseudoduganella chitinolytica]|uniref:CopG family transcriptional regulator n=1 Tax=Pseudoduganella chitinolytica TaxID=34070 RepID=A0ABY8BG58_9BURK|nr:hypothetical protein [Pseudoduganella chitinolytica]WEF34889.1 hypothetical protein PX653_09055 [Pseudoduganella chitinolytica]
MAPRNLFQDLSADDLRTFFAREIEQYNECSTPRNIEVKTLLNADEFVALQQECKAADVKHSTLLRNLAKSWLADRKDKRQQRQAERPAYGQNLAMLLPTRVARPRMHMRL